MTDRKEFIEREILPTLGEFENDYDLDGICTDVSEFDAVEGYVWKRGLSEDDYWAVVARHDMRSTYWVTVDFDDELSKDTLVDEYYESYSEAVARFDSIRSDTGWADGTRVTLWKSSGNDGTYSSLESERLG